ncbi:uncharacterized protein PV07_11175 [Cladophialophora immunda]|uniref:Zn(2)-C6 fungal-type domain-containing protein n=1 Tax=Cladophialophora immunda TaxID=569365 RepID=A0A0D2BX74_9EURO|nr:uncharacterized protein PV07_11175 [Cladophialophora immunda]KIW22930.1 hypothetical protein PV07_11175 [Cladophialophora immunda]OQU93784.1 Fungal specific transcription factor domain-containing protein [Cladophialophora immunda]
MAPEKPLPVESLLPFKQNRSPETRAILQDAQFQDSNSHSQSPESLEDDEGSGNEKPKRQKRSRACVACRNMKIRCLPVEGQDACNACAKVNRECVMPGPPRKRQKTVHKVAELEKKINALTDALLAKQQSTDGAKPEDESPPKDAPTSGSSEPAKTDDTSNTSLDTYQRSLMERALRPTAQPEFNRGCNPVDVEPIAKDDYVDVIDRGDLSMESATAMFNHWMKDMCSSCPYVVFPPDTDPQELRRTRPITFLTILAIASPVVQPSAQTALTIEINRQIAERVLFHGDKSLDVIQAMLLNSQYYVRPRTARDLAFNQNIQSAISLSLELGIGKRSKLKRSPAEEVELARTWLACYQANINVTTILRLPTLIRFSPRTEECLEILRTSPHAAPSDRWLCATVALARLAEEVAAAFNMDDPGADLDFTEPRVQYQLKCFQRQLQQWEKDTDVAVDHRLVQHQAACLNLYIHEIAVHYDHNVDDFRPGVPPLEQRRAPDFVTSAHIEALSTLLESSHRVLDTYLSLEVKCARNLSNLYIVWNAYAVVVLIKLHWIFNSPESKLGSVFVPDLKTGYYLDAVLNRLGEVSAGGGNPCAEAFGFVFMKLKIWHIHRSGQLSDDEQGQDDQTRRRRASSILRQDPASIIASAKRMEYPGLGSAANLPPTRPYTPALLPGGGWTNVDKFGSNLNAAYDAASYGNTNWDQFNFSTEELDMFDIYMNNSGWMGYLL